MNAFDSKPITNAIDYLGKTVTVTVDRTIGSKHPKFDMVYPCNYGYVPGTISPDGEELDAYVLNINKPLTSFTGMCAAIIHRTNDNDDKLVIIPADTAITEQEIRIATNFQEQYFRSEIKLAS